MRLFLGVDGGQSATTALIGDETGRVLATGSGGPCNHVGAAEGADKLKRAVAESVGSACRQAGVQPRFEAACFGMSGGPDDKEALLAELLDCGKLIVTHDALIALAGATAGDPGIVTIAGTGSIAFGRNAEGRTERAGGWGYIFGDEGGGFDIARHALRAALRMEEGWGPSTLLRERLLSACGATDANQLLHLWYTDPWPRPRVARFARLVDDTAAAGDPVAREILENAAQQLAGLAAAVRRQLWQPGAQLRAACIGGVFRSGRLAERFRLLLELEEGTRCHPPVHGPAAGALLEAYRASNLKPELSQLPEFKT